MDFWVPDFFSSTRKSQWDRWDAAVGCAIFATEAFFNRDFFHPVSSPPHPKPAPPPGASPPRPAARVAPNTTPDPDPDTRPTALRSWDGRPTPLATILLYSTVYWTRGRSQPSQAIPAIPAVPEFRAAPGFPSSERHDSRGRPRKIRRGRNQDADIIGRGDRLFAGRRETRGPAKMESRRGGQRAP